MAELTGLVFETPKVESPPLWEPQIGAFCEIYKSGLSGIDDASVARVFTESAAILGNCSAPWTKQYSETGLVIGYVQSGKTLSFTTIAALARDNGYGMVIVLAGVTNLLKGQSTDRLVDDLALKKNSREWKILENPGGAKVTPSSMEFQNLRDSLAGWHRYRNEGGTAKKPSILVTVLKHSGRLKHLANLLRLVDLTEVPVLIVDDESDQATPNTRAARNLQTGDSEESSTYAAVQELRNTLSRHSYLQYTATPQANLLAAKVDELSPRFAKVISAGNDYTGGEFFFGPDESPNLVTIPAGEIYSKNKYPDEAPESLLNALRIFWLGATHTLLTGDESSVRSMMIQASQQTDPHRKYAQWAQDTRSHWAGILRSSSTGSWEHLKAEFRESFDELLKTLENPHPFEAYLRLLPEVIDETNIVLVNSNDDAVSKVEWYQAQFWILVGGMKLDRGFTVKGIISTYMPRSAAENADVLQQRARFFGYHGSYAGLIRVFLGESTRKAFISYLQHENFLRSSLLAHQGKPLSEWKRDFVLHRAIKRPVRQSVVGHKMVRSGLSDKWLAPNYMHTVPETVESNARWLHKIEAALRSQITPQDGSLVPGWRDLRQGPKHELFPNVPARAIQDLLLGFKFADGLDESKMLALELAVSMRLDDDPNLAFNVVFMNGLSTDGQLGREVDEVQGLTNIFIGRNPSSAGSDYEALTYVGDRFIQDSKVPTLHLRRIKIKGGQSSDFPNDYTAAWLAVHLTQELEIDFYSEAI